jgi:CMP-N,N'-diacetyllegionaminic acid synthase
VNTVLAIIPARGGSKGIPRKNLANAGGKSLLRWTVDAALQSDRCTRVIVSTDSNEIAAHSLECGAEVPFLRPPELATEYTPGIAPILHALRWLMNEEDYRPDYVVKLQPTSPLRTASDIDGAMSLAIQKSADAVVSVTPAIQHPFWMKVLTDDGRMQDFTSSGRVVAQRQDLSPVYALNGAIYLAKREVLLKHESWYTERTYAYVMPVERSLDVDTPEDLRLVDLMLRDSSSH